MKTIINTIFSFSILIIVCSCNKASYDTFELNVIFEKEIKIKSNLDIVEIRNYNVIKIGITKTIRIKNNKTIVKIVLFNHKLLPIDSFFEYYKGNLKSEFILKRGIYKSTVHPGSYIIGKCSESMVRL